MVGRWWTIHCHYHYSQTQLDLRSYCRSLKKSKIFQFYWFVKKIFWLFSWLKRVHWFLCIKMTQKRSSPSMLEFKELLWVCTGSLLCLVSTFLVVQALSEHRLFWYVSGWALLMTLKLALLWTGNAGRLLLDMELMVVLIAINCFINWTSWLRISICKKVKSVQWKLLHESVL